MSLLCQTCGYDAESHRRDGTLEYQMVSHRTPDGDWCLGGSQNSQGEWTPSGRIRRRWMHQIPIVGRLIYWLRWMCRLHSRWLERSGLITTLGMLMVATTVVWIGLGVGIDLGTIILGGGGGLFLIRWGAVRRLRQPLRMLRVPDLPRFAVILSIAGTFVGLLITSLIVFGGAANDRVMDFSRVTWIVPEMIFGLMSIVALAVIAYHDR